MAKVIEWKASYYYSINQTWVYGRLTVLPRFLRFTEDREPSDNLVDYRIYFDEFVELKKKSTNFFYAAITVRTKSDEYWFSSLDSRTNVFNVIEHFWKESLFTISVTDDAAQKCLGGALLKILHESANTLSNTSKTLVRQGQQIDGACRTMNKLHNDLDVAETIIHSLDSWMNQWNVDTPHIHIDVSELSQDDTKVELPVLYADNEKGKHLPGSLVLCNKRIEVLDIQRNPVHLFVLREISEVTVHTPWEMTVMKTAIGKPDIFVHLVSARLLHVLGYLEPLIGSKLNYEDPPEGAVRMQRSSSADDELSRNLQLDAINKASQTQKGLKTVSEAEAAEMSQILQNMKSMALGLQNEQSRQLTQLDALSDSVDKANERIKKDARNVKKLM